jgi:D-arginine dehydrogenase
MRGERCGHCGRCFGSRTRRWAEWQLAATSRSCESGSNTRESGRLGQPGSARKRTTPARLAMCISTDRTSTPLRPDAQPAFERARIVMPISFDVIILGAGMAGASLAAELGVQDEGEGARRVLLLEIEEQPGRHATGRSAAMFFESYGNPTVRALTRASRRFLEQPPAGFADCALMTPRAAMHVANAEGIARLDATLAGADAAPTARRISADEARRRVPILRADWVAGAVLDESGCDMEVAAILQGYLRLARRAGVQVVVGAAETSVRREGGVWLVQSRVGDFRAPVLVNATGAWADSVARQAGAATVGLQPMRRTAVTINAPTGMDGRQWPLVIDVDETIYFKPDAGQLLLSPANEDPMEPCDVVPEELDIAIAVDRFETLTTERVTRINHRWAGLRSFVADRSPVVGYDRQAEGFFWLAGQGGYGIQMAPALARTAAALLLDRPVPEDVARQGVTAEDIVPSRTALVAPTAT